MKPEPYSHVRPDDYHLYTTPDEEAPEDEVARFIASLVYMLKPKVVIETGTALGFTAQKIGSVLKYNDNGGMLYTFEVDAAKAIEAAVRTVGLPVHIQTRPACSGNPMEFGTIDLMFIDAVLEQRHLEYLHWEPALKPGGIAILHDTLKFDPPKSEVEKLPGEKIWLPSPRGVTLIQKPLPKLSLIESSSKVMTSAC